MAIPLVSRPSVDEWLTELARSIERADERHRFLWNALLLSLVPIGFAFLTVPWPTVSLGLDGALWLVSITLTFYIWFVDPFVNRLYSEANPQWARRYRKFQGAALRRYVELFGPPKAGRLIQGNSVLSYAAASLPLAFLLWHEPSLVWKGIAIVLVYAFGVRMFSFGAFFLPRSFVAASFGRVLDNRKEGDPAWRLLQSPLRRAVRLSLGLRFAWMGIVVVAFAITAPYTLFREAGWLSYVAVVSAGSLGWAAIRLLLLIYVNVKRQMLEELHRGLFLGEFKPDEVLRLALLIEAFTQNRFVLNLPLQTAYDRLKLDDVPLEDLIEEAPGDDSNRAREQVVPPDRSASPRGG